MVCRGRRRRHKTAVAISTADSVPIQTMTYPTCSYQSIGIPESVALITKVVREALSGGGVSPQDCAGCCVGMPCYGENPANDREIVRLLTDALTPVPVYVVNDGEVGWAGSLACGRESILFPAQVLSHLDAGVTKNLPAAGVGGVFGDEGSCYWIGRQGMSLFSKEADGRLPRGPLYDLVHGEFGLTEDYQFIDRIVREFAPYREKSRGSSGTSYRPPGLATQPLPRCMKRLRLSWRS